MKLMDQRTDKSRAFIVKIASRMLDKNVADEVIKIATSVLPEAETSSYGYERGMLFPTGSREDTILSRVYFEGQRTKLASEDIESIDERLKAFEGLFGIDMDFGIAELKKAATVKLAELLPGYFVETDERSLRDAQYKFFEKCSNLSIEDRCQFAENFIKEAEEAGAAIADGMRVYAGQADCDYNKLREQLFFRKAAADRVLADGTAYIKLAEELAAVDLDNATREEKVALYKTVLAQDMATGLNSPRFDNQIPDAWRVVFNTVKKAEDAQLEPDSGNVPHVRSLTKADIIGRYGEDALEEVEDENGDIDYDRLKGVMQLFGDGESVDASNA